MKFEIQQKFKEHKNTHLTVNQEKQAEVLECTQCGHNVSNTV